jgi:DNA-binding transcriptional LysR family regulator
MDLRQLEALVGIADHGSFSAAAHALGTVQSNISGRIARLETELDTVLIDRATGLLTSDGALTVARSRRVLGELEALMEDVISTDSEVVGMVRIGMIGTTGRWLIPQTFDALAEHHPRIALRITEGTNSSLEAMLLNGQLDLAIFNQPSASDELSFTPLFDEELVLVVKVDHPLTQARRKKNGELSFTALRDIPLLLPLTGTTMRRQIDTAASEYGVTLIPSIEIDGVRTLTSLVIDGYGPGILPATAVARQIRDQVAFIPLEGFLRREVGIVSRRFGLPSAPSRAVTALLESIIAEEENLPAGIHRVPVA